MLYLRLLQQRHSINVPITANKVFHLGALGIRVLAKQVQLDVPTCLAILRGTAGWLLIAAEGDKSNMAGGRLASANQRMSGIQMPGE